MLSQMLLFHPGDLSLSEWFWFIIIIVVVPLAILILLLFMIGQVVKSFRDNKTSKDVNIFGDK